MKSYETELVKIAKLQRELLEQRIDLTSFKLKPFCQYESYGFLGMKKRLSADGEKRERLLSELEGLKSRLEIPMIYPKDGMYWWKLPWDENFENTLLAFLIEPETDGEWKFETSFNAVSDGERTHIIFKEIGHCSLFDGTAHTEYFEVSRYTADQRNKIMSAYDKSISEKEIWFQVLNNDKYIYSHATQNLYNSATDYVYSWEHMVAKDRVRQKMRESLAEEHVSNAYVFESNSLHYENLFGVGKYSVTDKGVLKEWNIFPYILLDGKGQLPNELLERRMKRDAFAATAAYISLQPNIKIIPTFIMGNSFSAFARDSYDAVAYALLATCFANKLTVM